MPWFNNKFSSSKKTKKSTKKVKKQEKVIEVSEEMEKEIQELMEPLEGYDAELDDPTDAQLKLAEYGEGEAVLARHSRCLYSAKIVSVQVDASTSGKKSVFFYLVHFNGWNKKYDTYLRQDHLLPVSDENNLKMQVLAQRLKVQLKRGRKN